ncbi:MAG: sulfatase activating formylglycine-generating enzyme [Planctomycetota bacterium]|jgi:formylglycine-generating enzyme required for sulfatase activity
MKSPVALTIVFALAAQALPLTGATAQTLTADVIEVSTAGGTQTFTLNAGVAHSSEYYLLLGSLSGTTPGISVNGHVLPLNLDSYLLRTFDKPNQVPLGNSFGMLPAAVFGIGGEVTATFSLPPGLGASVIGRTVNHAYAAIDPGTGAVTMTSNAVSVNLVPPVTSVNELLVPGGTFVMGDHYGVGYSNELPLHSVTLDPFYMDVYEATLGDYIVYLNSAYSQGLITMTQGQIHANSLGGSWFADTLGSDSSSRIYWDGATFTPATWAAGVISPAPGKLTHPVYSVSWFGAAAYANWRSLQDGLTPCYHTKTWKRDLSANGYHLPTESQWEYAARGGQNSPYLAYPWGNLLSDFHANFDLSGDPYETGSIPKTTPVGYYDGSQIPSGPDMVNGYGLYDMVGNLSEWCDDWYGPYDSSPSTNPLGPINGNDRVTRSRSWTAAGLDLRSAQRGQWRPDTLSRRVGFRLARATTP